jgi:type IV secretory pathway VirB3-like protein
MGTRNMGLTADVLFVGATRPPMRWGVTYAALLCNLVFTMEAFLLTRNLLTLLVCIPIHGMCALLCARDPRFFALLKGWLRLLVRSAGAATMNTRQGADLDQALHGTLALERPARRLSRLIDFLDPTDPEGVHARLERWCESAGGDYAWVFDNAVDSVIERIGGPGPNRARSPAGVTDFVVSLRRSDDRSNWLTNGGRRTTSTLGQTAKLATERALSVAWMPLGARLPILRNAELRLE